MKIIRYVSQELIDDFKASGVDVKKLVELSQPIGSYQTLYSSCNKPIVIIVDEIVEVTNET